MRKDILLIAHFTSDFDRSGNNRFNYLAELLAQEHNVELVTSDFSHIKKEKRNKIEEKYSYKITMIPEPIYTKNVSLKRFYSHFIMGLNLEKYLRTRKKPDVIYCAVPSLDVAKVAAKYAKRNHIDFVIDVQDLWPEAFKMVLNIPILSDILFYPMKKQAEYIYANADKIIAVSETYVNRALKSNSLCSDAHSIYIGTDLSIFDQIEATSKFIQKSIDEIWLAYVGTLGHSYDLTTVFQALQILKERGIENIKFIVMGDGPLKRKFEENAKTSSLNVTFTGRLAYKEMVSILKMCDIAVNPISPRTAASIINKHADYAAAGLPVINTQESIEYRNLVDEYQMGFNCESSNPIEMADKILLLCHDERLRKKMSDNSRKLAVDKFDRKSTYGKIVKMVSGTN